MCTRNKFNLLTHSSVIEQTRSTRTDDLKYHVSFKCGFTSADKKNDDRRTDIRRTDRRSNSDHNSSLESLAQDDLQNNNIFVTKQTLTS